MDIYHKLRYAVLENLDGRCGFGKQLEIWLSMTILLSVIAFIVITAGDDRLVYGVLILCSSLYVLYVVISIHRAYHKCKISFEVYDAENAPLIQPINDESDAVEIEIEE